jgi:hypothetical protein
VAATATDPKVAALAAARSLNPHPERVADEAFLASPFCDARDLVQVKYEMVRRVRVDKVPVTQAARAFGYCRQAFYEIAAALDAGGPSALVPGKPGPKGPTKLTAQVMDRVCDWLAAEPALTSWQLVAKLRDELGLTVHPRCRTEQGGVSCDAGEIEYGPYRVIGAVVGGLVRSRRSCRRGCSGCPSSARVGRR